MDNNFVSRFKVKLIKAEKKIKETYSDEELEAFLQKSLCRLNRELIFNSGSGVYDKGTERYIGWRFGSWRI